MSEITAPSNPPTRRPTDDDRRDRPYQVVVFVGAAGEVPPPVHGVRVADLTPATAADPFATVDPSTHPVIERLRASALSPADLRSKVLLLVSPTADAAVAVTAYAALSAFAGRRIDAACRDARLEATAFDLRVRNQPDGGRPDGLPEILQLGAPHPQVPQVIAEGPLTGLAAAGVRYVRRLRYVPPPDALGAITRFVEIAALRSRGDAERFPVLCRGDEPVTAAEPSEPSEPSELPDVPAGVDLDGIRRAAIDLRRAMRFEDRSSLAPKIPLSTRARTLLAAAALPTEAVMVALGASTPDGNLWHCPRPSRHTNGDANASMRVEAGRVRCFRCDPEKVDGLRLVADVKDCSIDEAADWLLATVAPQLDQLLAAVTPPTTDPS